jgi:hypothetical protein
MSTGSEFLPQFSNILKVADQNIQVSDDRDPEIFRQTQNCRIVSTTRDLKLESSERLM